MAVLKQFLKGVDVTAYTLTPQTVGTDGTLSAGSASSLAGLWESATWEMIPVTEEISAADSTMINNVIVKRAWRLTTTAILRKAALTGTVNPLPSIINAGDYFQATLTRTSNLTAGAGTAGWSGYLLCESYRESYAQGKCTAEATFIAVDAGAVPTYPGSGGQA